MSAADSHVLSTLPVIKLISKGQPVSFEQAVLVYVHKPCYATTKDENSDHKAYVTATTQKGAPVLFEHSNGERTKTFKLGSVSVYHTDDAMAAILSLVTGKGIIVKCIHKRSGESSEIARTSFETVD